MPRIRSAFCGIAATLLDAVTMIALVEGCRCGYGLAAALAALAGASMGFYANRTWAFRNPSPHRASHVLGFIAIACVNALAVAGAVHVMTGAFHAPYLLAKAIAAAVTFVFWTYPMQARLFAPTSRQGATHDHAT